MGELRAARAVADNGNKDFGVLRTLNNFAYTSVLTGVPAPYVRASHDGSESISPGLTDHGLLSDATPTQP